MTETTSAPHSTIGDPPAPRTSVIVAYEAGSLAGAAFLLWLAVAIRDFDTATAGFVAFMIFSLITIVLMAAFMLPFSRLPTWFGNVWMRTIVWGGVTYFVVGIIYLGIKGGLPYDMGSFWAWPTLALADVGCLIGACVEISR